jgi:glycoside/pentoside/hexuronide:cation symporter, GPH family
VRSPVSLADVAARIEPEPSEQSRSERVPLWLKLVYGAPSFAGAAMTIPIAIHMTKFYSDVVLVPLGFLGIAIAVARALDAISDPLVGFFSDRTRTRWGRRRPYMILAAPVCAVFFYLLFTPPPQLSGRDAVLWFAGTFILYSLAHTTYVIPHYALGPELTLDYNERSTLFGVREGFVILGTIVAALLPGVLIQRLGNERSVFFTFSLFFGTILIVLYTLLAVVVRERPDFYERKPSPFIPGIRRALRNRPFRILLATYVVASIPGAIPGTLMPYFNEYVVRPANPPLWLAIFLGAYFGAGFLFLPAWVWAARRFGKRPTWLASFAMGTTGGAAMFFIGQGDTTALLLLLCWAGSAFGAGLFLGPAIQADVIDYDELHTGKRREAQYAAFWSILPKFVVIPSAAIPIAFLGSIGYKPNVPQTPEVVLAIKVLFALTPAFFSVFSFFIAWRLPIDETVHRAILSGVAAHRRGESARDPLTGELLAPQASRNVPEETAWFLDNFSTGELRRALANGPATLLRDVQLAAGASIALCIGAVAIVVSHVSDLKVEPGPLAVLAVVGSGISLSAAAFHLLRLGAARRFRTTEIPSKLIELHLEAANRR